MSSGSTASKSESSSARRRADAANADLDRLIALARAGDGHALDQLIEGLSEQLWAELSSRRRSNRTGPSQGSSDLVQDTLIRVREQFHKFERESFADFKQWARTVLYRRRQEWMRNHHSRNAERHKRMIWNELRARIAADPEQVAGSSLVEKQEETDRAYALFQALKPHEQFVIDLRLFQGLSYKQIAELTGTKEDAPRQAFNRAMARLRAGYENHDEP
jgi:RNA polymerase sigma factor (sigma-70 family)